VAQRAAATIGFRVRTGRATAVLMSGSAAAPFILERRAVQLCDPTVPESRQPYHAALELSAAVGTRVVRRATRAVHAVATRTVRELADALRAAGHRLTAVGLVIGSDTDPPTLHNAHMRAHALEGRLFWKALEAAAERLEVPYLTLVEHCAFAAGAAALGRTPEELQRVVTELGRAVGRPWGAEEKTAALAAWMALAG